ncbi:MAG TPA: hypothetical protein VM489_08230 [Burkholderiales bacterium]|nr:hypothetical protein [Burkholderiales bacterium]
MSGDTSYNEFVPLAMAAAVAYVRVVGPEERARPTAGLLDVVASALSVWVPIFGSRVPAAPRLRLADEEVARGRFCDGATRLCFRDGRPPVGNLAILHGDLDAGIRRLKRAGLRFSEAMVEPSPRRVPRILPRLPG